MKILAHNRDSHFSPGNKDKVTCEIWFLGSIEVIKFDSIRHKKYLMVTRKINDLIILKLLIKALNKLNKVVIIKYELVL